MTTQRWSVRLRIAGGIAALGLLAGACSGGDDPEAPKRTAPTPQGSSGECGELRLAYNPDNGFEASTFIVGRLARDELGCDVTYVKTDARKAWRLVASGKVDAYLDAYGSADLAEEYLVDGSPVTQLGSNGVRGGVDLLAPYYFNEYRIVTSRDLPELPPNVFGSPGPRLFTTDQLIPLATSFLESQRLEFRLRDYIDTHPNATMGDLLVAPRLDDEARRPDFYLVAAPRAFLGNGPGRLSVQIPGSSADECTYATTTSLCSLDDFTYQKIVNTEFAESGNPAYTLIYNYRLRAIHATTVLEIVQLSGFRVAEADVASWINTHPRAWRRWLETP